MKTIVFLSHTAELNGAELWLLQFLRGINRRKFNPLLVVPRSGPLADQATVSGVETVSIPFKWWLSEKRKVWRQPLSWIWNLRSVWRIKRLMDERRADALFTNSSVALSGALATRLKGIPHIWAVHEILGGKHPQMSFVLGQRTIIRLIRSLSCRVVVSSRAAGRCFEGSTKVRLVYSGVDLPSSDLSDSKIIRAKFNISEDDVVLGTVGRICDEKGQLELIRALSLLDKNYRRVKLVFAGRIKDKSYFRRLQRLIEQESLEDRVIFAGFQNEIFPFLRALDCLFVVSELESFGRTIIEAMSVRTPVIAVRSGGVPEIVTSGENGLLLDSREPEELKKAIVSFFRDRGKFIRMAGEGLETVKNKFSLAHQIDAAESVLEECLE